MWNILTDPEALPSLRLVKAAGGQMEALIVKSRLEAEGIPVHLRYEAAGSLYGLAATGMGRVDVLVPEAFAEAALRLCGGEAEPIEGGDAA